MLMSKLFEEKRTKNRTHKIIHYRGQQIYSAYTISINGRATVLLNETVRIPIVRYQYKQCVLVCDFTALKQVHGTLAHCLRLVGVSSWWWRVFLGVPTPAPAPFCVGGWCVVVNGGVCCIWNVFTDTCLSFMIRYMLIGFEDQ